MVLIARSNTIQGNDLLSSSNAITGFLYQRQSALVYYFNLGTINDSLLRENSRLRDQLAQLRFSVDTLRDSTALRPLPADSGQHIQYAQYTYRQAQVINNSVALRNNYITLNRGAEEGIRKGMAVISGTGVVGKVVHVSRHFSTVLSVLSSLQTVSAQLPDGTTGQVSWVNGNAPIRPDVLYMPDVPGQIPLHRGNIVRTTTYSFFPPEVPVGVVDSVLIVKKTGKRLLYLKPATNFRNLRYVYVVENSYIAEQKALEARNGSELIKPKTRK